MSAARSRARRPRRWRRRVGLTLLALALASEVPVLVLRFVAPPTSAYMLAARWAMATGAEPRAKLRYQWVPYARISPYLRLAVIAGEDQHFPFHHGFDFGAIADALRAAERGRRLRGASTISQQTARNLFLWSARSYVRKAIEAWFTVLLEATWPKRRILAVYLNIAQFGSTVYGAEAASRAFFHRPASELTEHQAALLAAVLPDPRGWHVSRPSPLVRERARWIERQMRQLGGLHYLATFGG